MKDSEIIALYFDRDEKAIEYTEQKYRRYCYAVCERLLNNPEDAKECLNDVWLAAWNSIPPNRPPSLKSYLGAIAKNLSAKRLRDINRKKRGGSITDCLGELSEALPGKADTESLFDDRELTRALERFLKKQTEVNRSLFLCRYYYLDDIRSLSERFHMSENSVKLRLFRLREKLKNDLEKEGVL